MSPARRRTLLRSAGWLLALQVALGVALGIGIAQKFCSERICNFARPDNFAPIKPGPVSFTQSAEAITWSTSKTF